MAPSTEKDDITSSLSSLALKSSKDGIASTGKSKSKSKKVVADSWEDDDESDDDPPKDSVSKPSLPAAPVRTPISSTHNSGPDWASLSHTGPDLLNSANDSKRPEKTDAVARRMIAAGLGLKAPKQTEEQKAYQRSIREQEKKKREQEKADEQKKIEAVEQAKAAVWDD